MEQDIKDAFYDDIIYGDKLTLRTKYGNTWEVSIEQLYNLFKTRMDLERGKDVQNRTEA